MKKETWTLSFLPTLDDMEYKGELVARDWQQAETTESGMFTGFIKRYESGSFAKTHIELRVCRYGMFIHYQFDYGTNLYGIGRPFAVDCGDSVHRGNAPEFTTDAMRSVIYYDLANNGNLNDQDRKEIVKLFDKIKDKITNDLKGLDNGKL